MTCSNKSSSLGERARGTEIQTEPLTLHKFGMSIALFWYKLFEEWIAAIHQEIIVFPYF